jgi:hypothetical protein
MAAVFPIAPQRLREALGWWRRGLARQLLGPRLEWQEWQALAAYRGLVQQAYGARPFHPEVSADLWWEGGFRSPRGLRPFFTPARREREPSSHHYGHDVLLKRHAGLPLVGPPLPLLLEHGLKVAPSSEFEPPRSWSRGYLCMGPLRARWLRERHGGQATPIGPWIHYAQPLLDPAALAELRASLGPTLLVLLAHSWDRVERRMDLGACVAAVAELAASHGYRQVIWLRHWQDPPLQAHLPPHWIVACNGHRANPWFLDGLRTLLELADGLASNAFGTHLGYAVAMERRLHWLDQEAEQDLARLPPERARLEALEWAERQRLSQELRQRLDADPAVATVAVRELLDPYWGLGLTRTPAELRQLLKA